MTSPIPLPSSFTDITDFDTINMSADGNNISGKCHLRKIGHVVFVFVVATSFNETITSATAWVTIPEKYRPSKTTECVYGQYASTSTGVLLPMNSCYIYSDGKIKQSFSTGAVSGARYMGIWIYSI